MRRLPFVVSGQPFSGPWDQPQEPGHGQGQGQQPLLLGRGDDPGAAQLPDESGPDPGAEGMGRGKMHKKASLHRLDRPEAVLAYEGRAGPYEWGPCSGAADKFRGSDRAAFPTLIYIQLIDRIDESCGKVYGIRFDNLHSGRYSKKRFFKLFLRYPARPGPDLICDNRGK